MKATLLLMMCACGSITSGSQTVDAPIGADAKTDAGADAGTGHDIRIEVSGVNGLVNGQLVAVQDGDGAWTALTGDNGVYLSHVDSDRFGAVSACVVSDLESFTQFVLQTAADGTTVQLSACEPLPRPFTISGTVSGLAAGDMAYLRTHGGVTDVFQNGPYSLAAAAGTADLFASLVGVSGNKVIRKPALDITGDRTIDLDFSTALAFDTPALTIGDATAQTLTTIYNNDRFYRLAVPFVSSTTYEALPAALAQPGDLEMVESFVADGRSATVVGQGGPITMMLPASFVAPTPVIVTTGYKRLAVTFPTGGGTLPIVTYDIDYFTFSDTTLRSVDWDVTISDAWTAGAPTIDFTVPDLSSLPGFDASLELDDQEEIDASISRDEATSVDIRPGAKRASATSSFSFAAPAAIR